MIDVGGSRFDDAGGGFDVFGLHPPTLQRAFVLGQSLYHRYFRVLSDCAAHVPAAGPTIVVANHGGALPMDAALLCMDLLQHSQPTRIPRPIIDRFIPGLPFVNTLFTRLGGVTGTRANVRRLLERGELLVLFPEGTSGIAKPLSDRYRIQDWSVGHAEMALRHGAAIVPVAIVGSEESWPVLGRLRRLHPFGAPYLPVPALPVPLPIRYHFHYGDPIQLADRPDATAADDPAAVRQGAERIRRELELLLRETISLRKARWS